MAHCDILSLRSATRSDSSRLNRANFGVQGEPADHSALLAGLSPEQCSEIFACAKIRNFARGERLFSQGQPIQALIMLRRGTVKLTQQSHEGKEVILWLNGPGDALGMHADEDGSNHSCSARAMEHCQVFVWESRLLEMLISQYPLIQVNLGRIVARRLSELEERFREIASEQVPMRLALVLMRLLKSVGKTGHAGVDVLIKHAELAQITGTTLFSISRTLSKWADSGCIVPQRKGVVTIDPDRLMQHTGLFGRHAEDCHRQRRTG